MLQTYNIKVTYLNHFCISIGHKYPVVHASNNGTNKQYVHMFGGEKTTHIERERDLEREMEREYLRSVQILVHMRDKVNLI